jgi:putative peptide zinc metalloprotease protein
MSRTAYRLLGAILVIGLLLGPGAVAGMADGAEHGGNRNGDNIVYLVNRSDGAHRSQASVGFAVDTGTSVMNQNIAVAYASCTNCRTVAVAIQVVILEQTPTNFQPTNTAIAINDTCHYCETFAYANQVILRAGSNASVSERYVDQAENVRRNIAAVAASSESFPQMTSDLDGLTQQLVGIVRAAISTRDSVGEDQRQAQQEGQH